MRQSVVRNNAMHTTIAPDIKKIIKEKVVSLDRGDLFREPIVGFSSAKDTQYEELKQLIGEWHLSPTELLENAETVISYFVPFTKAVISDPKKVADGSNIWGEAYMVLNAYFDEINQAVIAYLKDKGYAASSIPATHTYDPKDMKSMWSHRSAAVIAGIGSFGANRMVITEKGSGGRFCTVLTTAMIEKETKQIKERCLYNKNGSCGLCFEICPVRALEPNSFHKFACQYVCDTHKKSDALGADTCGKCISVCPLAFSERLY